MIFNPIERLTALFNKIVHGALKRHSENMKKGKMHSENTNTSMSVSMTHGHELRFHTYMQDSYFENADFDA